MSAFERSFGIVVGYEGGYSDDPADPGNWTGGVPGRGTCRGTKWGISAAAFPSLDIQALTLAEAATIYRQRYWAPLCGDSLPPSLALLVFDAAVNNGVARAARWLQAAVAAEQDGLIGPVSLRQVHEAVSRQGLAAVGAEFQARRVLFMAGLPGWGRFGLGWARRLCRLPFDTDAMEAQELSTQPEAAA